MWGLPWFMLGFTVRKKQLHLRNQELGNGLREGGANAGLVERDQEEVEIDSMDAFSSNNRLRRERNNTVTRIKEGVKRKST